METVSRAHLRRDSRDQTRARVRSRRKFQPAQPFDAGQPPNIDEGSMWPERGEPTGSGEGHLQWPYWIVLLVPWLTLTAAFILEHFRVCLMCIPDSVPLPP
jgi:hypothetical protein